MLLLLLSLQALAGVPSAPTHYSSDQSQARIDAILAAAVDKTVQRVHWTIRPFARPRLEPLATSCPGYTTHLDGSTFHIRCDGKDPFTWEVGKRAPWTSKEGKEMTVSLTRDGAALALDFRQEDGGKLFTYDFSGPGLVVTQKVYADQLTQPMEWTLSYAAR